MKEITITIPGPPIAKKRPRFARRGKFVQTYNDQQTEEGKWLLFARQHITKRFTGPVWINCEFVIQRPKSHYGTGKNSSALKTSAPPHCVTKPDVDNLVKFVKDCLNGEAWNDDSQVVGLIASKFYGDEAKTVVVIREQE